MEKKKFHITDVYLKKNGDNLRARRLLADFLGLDEKECKVPLNKCSRLLKKFVSDYNKLVKDAKKDKQESLF